MGRAKQFDIDEALMKAVGLFWTRGYEATSVQDLVDHLGIGRSSLYATFGGKHALFIRALRRYDEEYRGKAVAEIARSAASPRQAVARTYEAAIAEALKGRSRDGCFMVNAALELSARDPETEKIVSHAFTEMETFFRTMIEEGQAQGEIAEEVSATDAARALLGLIIGLRVLARSRPEAPLLRSIESQAETLLG